ncbi:TPA: DUF2384 domain-containing protein [Aeromonas sobria]|nr:DUF2384 domain-containing protein [Aeromonas sobria]
MNKSNQKKSIDNEGLTVNIMNMLGLREEPIDAHYQIVQGLDPKVIRQLADVLGVKKSYLCNMVGISSTEIRLSRNKCSHLSHAQSVKIYMFAKVIANGMALFDGESHLLLNWLEQPARALAGHKPQELLSTDVGAQAIIEFIGQLKYGVYV